MQSRRILTLVFVLICSIALLQTSEAGPKGKGKGGPQKPTKPATNAFAKQGTDQYLLQWDGKTQCALDCSRPRKPSCALFDDPAQDADCTTLASRSGTTQFMVSAGRFLLSSSDTVSTIFPLEAEDYEVLVEAVALDGMGSWSIRLGNGTSLDGPSYFRDALQSGCYKAKFAGADKAPYYLIAQDGDDGERPTLRLLNNKKQPVWMSACD